MAHLSVIAACALSIALFGDCAQAQSEPAAPPAARSHAAATGAGSTFISPLLTAWAAVYKDETKADIEYQPIGSGAGLDAINSGMVEFVATDQPLSRDELAKGGLIQFPIAFGAIVPVVNLAGVKAGELHLSGPLIADIFSGKASNWSDLAIAKLNPTLKLPSARIVIVHRADKSGTTFNFTHYLSQVSPSWKASLGEGKTIDWPSSIGASSNASVADWVKKMPNSIGYVEYSYVLTHDLTYACIENAGGQFVCPSAKSLAGAIESTNWNGTSDFNLVPTNAPGMDAYPIMATTFIVMDKEPKDKDRSDAALNFLRYGLEKGQVEAGALNYVPLPQELVSKVEAYLAKKD